MRNRPMLLDCPVCTTPYHVDRADLAGGRVVICSRCDARWSVGSNGFRQPYAHPAQSAHVGIAASAPAPDVLAANTRLARCAPAIAAVAMLAFAMMIIGARERIVRLAPRTAALYHAAGLPVNIRGLVFANVVPERLDQAAQITIRGEIENIVAHREPVPRLAYEVRDAAGQSLVTWTEKGPAKVLAAGKTLAFASMPHLLPDQARTVLVRFDADEAPLQISLRDR